MPGTNTSIVLRCPNSLNVARRNARTHSRKQIRQIADSISRFGFVTPILIDRELRVVAGHGRLQAAKLTRLTEVPTLMVDLPPDELRALAIADNQIAALAGWDRELLALEIAELEVAMPTFDLTVTGFDPGQIEILRDVAASRRARPVTDAIPEPEETAITCGGDLWHIGEHRLLCGDALTSASYDQLLTGALADLVIGDPPFNVPISGHVTSQKAHREFAMASGEMSPPQFQRFLAELCRQLARHSRSGSLHYLFMDWRSIADLIETGAEHYDVLLNIIVWVKPGGGMGSLYRSRHELIALFRNGVGRHTNNVELGANGRNRSNVWEYPGSNGPGADRALGQLHPTVKNREMIAEAIRDASRQGEIVLDPFGGSGTTMLAAHDAKRRAGLIEIDPLYCDVCIRRAQAAGLDATLASTGEPFAIVTERRRSDAVRNLERSAA